MSALKLIEGAAAPSAPLATPLPSNGPDFHGLSYFLSRRKQMTRSECGI